MVNKNYSSGKNIEEIQIDFLEQFVRTVVDTTISKVVLKPKTENIPNDWRDKIDLITLNNDIERLLKSEVRQKSKYGKSYVGFDMFNGVPILWVAPYSKRNQALRINGMEQYAVRVLREYSAIENSTPILRNEITYTSKDKTYLFLGGFGVNYSNNDVNAIPSKKVSKELFQESTKKNTFPFDYVKLETPKYIVEQNKFGTVKHDLGVLPVMEMLNKDVNDYGNDSFLSDWYPAQAYIPMICEYIKYIAWEMNLDHTRVIGMFSMADLQNIQSSASSIAKSKDPAKALQEALKNYANGRLLDTFNDNSMTGEDNAIKKKLLVRTVGGEGNNVNVMNSHFDGEKQVRGLQNLISLVYKICGYSWTVDESGASYQNVSQTQQTIRSVFETTKEKNELFTRQWKELLKKVFYVLFNKEKEWVELEKEFNEYVDFQIISNVLIQQNNDWRKTLELKNSGLISLNRAIKLLWPEMTDEEIEKEVERIKEDNKEAEFNFGEDYINDFNAFDNEKPFGSDVGNDEENENNGDWE